MDLGAQAIQMDPEQVQPVSPVEQDNQDENKDEASLTHEEYYSFSPSGVLRDHSIRDSNLIGSDEWFTNVPYDDLAIVSSLKLCLNYLILFVCA